MNQADIIRISCLFKEYLLDEKTGKWVLNSTSKMDLDNRFITSMVNARLYFSQLGGRMNINYKANRRFGLVVSKVVTISICNTHKHIYEFNYNNAILNGV